MHTTKCIAEDESNISQWSSNDSWSLASAHTCTLYALGHSPQTITLSQVSKKYN